MLDEMAAAAAQYKKMYDRVSALANIGVWECDLATDSLSWTDKVYDLFDLPPGSAVDRATSLACYSPESRRLLEQHRSEAIRTGRGFSLDILLHTAKGARKWIRLTVDVEQEDGKSVRIFGTKQDITAEREAQERVQALQAELIQMSRLSAMSAMASTLAHELNQPLATVSNYMSAARRLSAGEGVSDQIVECIVGAEQTALRAGEIIRRIRQMGKRHAPGSPGANLVEVIEEAVAVARLSHPRMSILYDFGYRGDVKADSLQVQQVLLSLLHNSGEAADKDGGQVEVRTALDGGAAMVCVSDTGSGIAPDALLKVFDLLQGNDPDGLGIGLSVSRTIIEAQGGKIWAARNASGGTEIRFTLPIPAAARAASDAASARNAAGPRLSSG